MCLILECSNPANNARYTHNSEVRISDGTIVKIKIEQDNKSVIAIPENSIEETKENYQLIAQEVFKFFVMHNKGRLNFENPQPVKIHDFTYICWQIENSDAKFCAEFLGEPFDGKKRVIYIFKVQP